MFSVEQKRSIANAIQKILRDTGHPELPVGEIQFKLYVHGRFQWSWADIQNNAAVPVPSVNPWNESQDRATPPNPQHGREPGKAGVMQVCNSCVYQNKAVVGSCCSPIDCKYTAEPDFSKSIDPSMLDAPPDKMKPKEPKSLAQYLGEYIEYEMIDNADCDTWVALLEQALDAYQSTENVTIKIERV